MSDQDMLLELRAALLLHIPSVRVAESGLEAELETRYGRLFLVFDHDTESRSMRVYTMLPPPAGAGPGFFTWCLSMNTLYWDVKVGIDKQGMLLVMADVDLEPLDTVALTRMLVVRVAAICELIDDDLVAYLLEKGLATPAQAQRWRRRGDEPA